MVRSMYEDLLLKSAHNIEYVLFAQRHYNYTRF
jgi:hypothetical protein